MQKSKKELEVKSALRVTLGRLSSLTYQGLAGLSCRLQEFQGNDGTGGDRSLLPNRNPTNRPGPLLGLLWGESAEADIDSKALGCGFVNTGCTTRQIVSQLAGQTGEILRRR